MADEALRSPLERGKSWPIRKHLRFVDKATILVFSGFSVWLAEFDHGCPTYISHISYADVKTRQNYARLLIESRALYFNVSRDAE